jgi:hypothetical protein
MFGTSKRQCPKFHMLANLSKQAFLLCLGGPRGGETPIRLPGEGDCAYGNHLSEPELTGLRGKQQVLNLSKKAAEEGGPKHPRRQGLRHPLQGWLAVDGLPPRANVLSGTGNPGYPSVISRGPARLRGGTSS